MLLILPPLVQPNTFYPSTVLLTGYLNAVGHRCTQMDLSIELLDRVLSPTLLKSLFEEAAEVKRLNKNQRSVLGNAAFYIDNVSAVKEFLRGRNAEMATLYANLGFWQGMPRLEDEEELSWDYGTSGTIDRAKHLCSLFIKNVCEVVEATDPQFQFIRYGERICTYLTTLEMLMPELEKPKTTVVKTMLELLDERLEGEEFVGFSVPFPGNLLMALQCAKHIRETRPGVKIIMGGGYVNTELRQMRETRLFDFVDYLCFDDGEVPLRRILEGGELVRTMTREGKFGMESRETESIYSLGQKNFESVGTAFQAECVSVRSPRAMPPVTQIQPSRLQRISKEDARQCVSTTTHISGKLQDAAYRVSTQQVCQLTVGLEMGKYFNFTDSTNPMHRLWSDGRWNKMMLAHGCYWHKCAFCDTSLDYIGNFYPYDIERVVDIMEQFIAETGCRGFHFVDEAAPPAKLKTLAEEILKRGLKVTYWTNIRFDRSFTPELCSLLARSGCIAVSGGVEVASPRVLKLINKGVTIEGVREAMGNLTACGIMVHAYLMYGFPTQKVSELYDSLGVVRDLFAEGFVQSAFWHRYAMTCHSPSGMCPEKYNARRVSEECNPFANNEIEYVEEGQPEWEKYGRGLELATYNYMRGTGFDIPLKKWFK